MIFVSLQDFRLMMMMMPKIVLVIVLIMAIIIFVMMRCGSTHAVLMMRST